MMIEVISEISAFYIFTNGILFLEQCSSHSLQNSLGRVQQIFIPGFLL